MSNDKVAGRGSFQNVNTGRVASAPVCRYCKTEGHVIRTCPNVPCRRCHRRGHVELDCQVVQCENCDRLGHSSEECWKCERCGRYGHLEDRCRVPVCENCNTLGHTKERCYRTSEIVCFACHGRGHMARSCPEHDRYEVPRSEGQEN